MLVVVVVAVVVAVAVAVAVAAGCDASVSCWFVDDGVRRYRKITSRRGGTRKCTCVAASTVSGTSRAVGLAGSGYHGFVWTLRLVKDIVVISAGRKRRLLLTTSRSLSACSCAISGGRYPMLLFPTLEVISTSNKLEANEHARRDSTVKLLSLKNSGGRVLISLFARKTIRPWDWVLLGARGCANKDLCGDENTAGGAVCTRLKGRRVGSATTPRLLSSTIDGGTKVSPASLKPS